MERSHFGKDTYQIIWWGTSSLTNTLERKWGDLFIDKKNRVKALGMLFASSLAGCVMVSQLCTLSDLLGKVVVLSHEIFTVPRLAPCIGLMSLFQKSIATVLLGLVVTGIKSAFVHIISPKKVILYPEICKAFLKASLNSSKEEFETLISLIQEESDSLTTGIEALSDDAQEELNLFKSKATALASIILNFNEKIRSEENKELTPSMKNKFTDELFLINQSVKEVCDAIAEKTTLAKDQFEYSIFSTLIATSNTINGIKAHQYILNNLNLGLNDSHLVDLMFAQRNLFSYKDFEKEHEKRVSSIKEQDLRLKASKPANKEYWDLVIVILKEKNVTTKKTSALLFALSFKILCVVNGIFWWNGPTFFLQSGLGLGLGLTGNVVKNNARQFSQGNSTDRLAWIFLANAPAFFVGNSIGIGIHSKSIRIALKSFHHAYF